MAKLKVHIPYSLKAESRANHIPGVCNSSEVLSAATSSISHPQLHICVILRSTVTLPTVPNPGEGSDTGYKSRQTVLPVNGWGERLCGRWCQARREKEQPGRKLPNTHSHCRNTLWLSWGWREEQAAASSFQAFCLPIFSLGSLWYSQLWEQHKQVEQLCPLGSSLLLHRVT